jgi:hypothetical protein
MHVMQLIEAPGRQSLRVTPGGGPVEPTRLLPPSLVTVDALVRLEQGPCGAWSAPPLAHVLTHTRLASQRLRRVGRRQLRLLSLRLRCCGSGALPSSSGPTSSPA